MARIFFYRAFRSTVRQDPTVDAFRTLIQEERLKVNQIHEMTGVAAQTITNWLNHKTIRPQNATITAATAPLGYVRHDRLNKDGTIDVRFEKARASDLDVRQEIDKQATFILRHGTAKQKQAVRKKKRNGAS